MNLINFFSLKFEVAISFLFRFKSPSNKFGSENNQVGMGGWKVYLKLFCAFDL